MRTSETDINRERECAIEMLLGVTKLYFLLYDDFMHRGELVLKVTLKKFWHLI